MSLPFDIYHLACGTRAPVATQGERMAPEDRHRIETIALLEGTPRRIAGILADIGAIRLFAAGEAVFTAGSRPEFLYLILTGRIALIGEGVGGETVIEAFGEGEALLTAAVVLDRPYLLTARALVETRVAAIPVEAFRELLDHEPGLARAIVNQQARHWRVLVRQIKDLKLRAGAQRLASYLLTQDRDGTGRIYLGMDRRLVAGRLGMTPEHLSRAFAQLRQYGVSATGRAVTITNDAVLRRFCDYDPLT
jgi:CRP/FNR family transcriptional activator FtrB